MFINEHLEKILLDAICTEPVNYNDTDKATDIKKEKYEKYKSKDYVPNKHEYIE